MQRETRQCQSCGESFVIDEADFGFYEKMAVPAPTFCPHCRMLRRFVFRNVHHLFRKREATEGREVFSMYPQQVAVKVYELDYWNSDAWDPLTYGRDYDFSRPFFEQFKELLYEVPWPAKSELRMVNSPYSNNAGGFKNCYLCFNGDDFENSAYVITGYLARESFDLFEARHTELSYEGYMIDESFKVFYSVNCEECHEVWFSRNMVGCQNCFGCVNLRNKTYHLFNEKVGKERYDAFMSAFNSGSHEAVEEMKERARGFWTKHPMKYALLINNQNATGEHIERSKNIKFSYGVHEAENVAYSQNISPPASDLYDYTTWGVSVSQMYETLTCGEETSIIKFAWECWPSSTEIEYSAHCRSSSILFGCVGLNTKKHCFLNKQYSREDYLAHRARIIQPMNDMPYISKSQISSIKSQTNSNTQNTKSQTREIVYKYGEFFPPEFSPFAYNETIAHDYFPLTKEQAEAKGYVWREPERREYETTVSAEKLPDDIAAVSDDVLKEIIKCSDCNRAYRIIPMELAFLKHIRLPLPRKCPECRFRDRFQFVNPPKYYHRACQCAGRTSEALSAERQSQGANRQAFSAEGKSLSANRESLSARRPALSSVYTNTATHFHGESPCPNEFKSSYAPDKPEIIYCEPCYQAEVV